MKPILGTDQATVYEGDCLDVMQHLSHNSVDLILTDPPFFRVKKNEWWDKQWEKPTEFLKWLDRIAEQWQRILKPNGSLYCFASPQMAAKVEVMLGDRFNVLNNIRWIKEAGWHQKASKEEARCFKEPWESVIFCEHYGADGMAKGEAGYEQKCDELRGFVFEPLQRYMEEQRSLAGLSKVDINVAMGFRPKADGMSKHYFSSATWQMPTQEAYKTIQKLAPGYFTRPYEELKQQYEELRRPFSVSADVPYTDVWTFPTVQAYPGKHPCEKPQELLKHIIQASSREGATVLDCFAGSGSTLLAAKSLGRKSIAIEIDPHWASICCQRAGHFDYLPSQQERNEWTEQRSPTPIQKNDPKRKQLTIFEALSS